MSSTRHFTIWCDGGDCPQFISTTASATVAQAREHAKAWGWRVGVPDITRQPGNNPRLDLCPAHARADR